jgi:crossover junction endodeoxyribonuclease RuvC
LEHIEDMARYPHRSWRSYGGTTGIAAVRAAPGVAQTRVSAMAAMPAAACCRVLGLDPGSRRTGFGVIDCTAAAERYVASGCIDVAGQDMVVRLQRIYAAVVALVEEHRPDMVAIERVFVHRNPDSALKLGQARGVALCAGVSAGASLHEYAPRAIKLAVTGYGAADKPQVARMVCTLLSLREALRADAADALAVALCHAQTRRIGALGLSS